MGSSQQDERDPGHHDDRAERNQQFSEIRHQEDSKLLAALGHGNETLLKFWAMRSLCFAASALLFAAVGLAQTKAPTKTTTPAEVEITSEPSHHLALQNSYVRVFQVEVFAGSATLMHRHRHDYVFITLGSAEISNQVEGKAPVTLTLHDGEARATDGGFAHIVRNLAPTSFRTVAIELLQDEKARQSPPPKWDEERGLHVLHGGTEDILFVKDGVRVSQIDLQIAGSMPKHHHPGPHLIVALTDLVLRSDAVGQAPSNLEMKAGDVKWLDSGLTQTETNVGEKEAKLVILEFK